MVGAAGAIFAVQVSYLDEKALDACFDLDRHLRHVDTIFERVLAKQPGGSKN